MMWTDWLVNHEDVAFHLVLSVLMPLIAGLGFSAVKLARRVCTPSRAPLARADPRL